MQSNALRTNTTHLLQTTQPACKVLTWLCDDTQVRELFPAEVGLYAFVDGRGYLVKELAGAFVSWIASSDVQQGEAVANAGGKLEHLRRELQS